MKFLAEVIVKLKDDIKDPQGIAVENILKHTQLDSTIKVKIGKIFSIEIDADNKESAYEKICQIAENVFVNPNLEKYEILKVKELC